MLFQGFFQMCGIIFSGHPWEPMCDLYFYRDVEEMEKEDQAAADKGKTMSEFQVNGHHQLLYSLLFSSLVKN